MPGRGQGFLMGGQHESARSSRSTVTMDLKDIQLLLTHCQMECQQGSTLYPLGRQGPLTGHSQNAHNSLADTHHLVRGPISSYDFLSACHPLPSYLITSAPSKRTRTDPPKSVTEQPLLTTKGWLNQPEPSTPGTTQSLTGHQL